MFLQKPPLQPPATKVLPCKPHILHHWAPDLLKENNNIPPSKQSKTNKQKNPYFLLCYPLHLYTDKFLFVGFLHAQQEKSTWFCYFFLWNLNYYDQFRASHYFWKNAKRSSSTCFSKLIGEHRRAFKHLFCLHVCASQAIWSEEWLFQNFHNICNWNITEDKE